MTEQTISTDGYALGRFRFGDVVARTFGTWFRYLPAFFLIYFICTLPSLIITLMAGTPPVAGQINPTYGLTTGLGTMVNSLLALFAQGILIVLAYNSLAGHPVTIGEALARAAGRYLPLLGAGICAGFMIILGFLLLLIPGVMLAVRYNVSIPACVIEEQGPIDSLGRSAELTKGFRWTIFGLALVFGAPTLIVTLAISAFAVRAFGIVPGMIMLKSWSALIAPLSTTLSTTIYHELRSAKEGGDVGRLATVFD